MNKIFFAFLIRKFAIFLFLLVNIVNGQIKETSLPKAQVTFITNCGFLLQVGDKKVLFDIESPKTAFDKASLLKTYDLMNKNKSPFNDIDLILISHPHDDHLGKKEMVEYLRVNKKVKFLSTIDTRDALLKTDPVSFNEIAANIITVDPYHGEILENKIEGIKIESIGMHHLGAPNYQLKDLSFAVTINGISIFFISDVDLSYDKNLTALTEWSKRNVKVDILFSCDVNLYINDYPKNGPEAIKRYINPDNIIAMHFNPGKMDEAEMNVKEFFPNIIIFKYSLEKKTFNVKNKK